MNYYLGRLGQRRVRGLVALDHRRNNRRETGRLERRAELCERPVDDHLSQVIQKLVGAILRGLELEQLRIIVDEGGVHEAVDKVLVLEDVDQIGNVGLDAADSELLERAEQLGARGRMVLGVRDDLDEQRVVVRRDDGAGEGVGRVDANAHALAAAVDLDAAVVGLKVLCWVFLNTILKIKRE